MDRMELLPPDPPDDATAGLALAGSGSDRPVIVVGCPRSGTTMLQVALHAHRRIALPPETWLLVEGYRRRATFGDLRERQGRELFADWVLSKRKVRDLRVSRAHLRELVLEGPPTVGSLLGVVLRAYAEKFDKPRWGDKRPSYYRNIAIVLRLFPDAQFVHLVRDGRDCVSSLKRMPWFGGTPHDAISAWCHAVDQGALWQRRLGPANWHELQYEHLVADPETELRRLCTFLGEDFDPSMVQRSEVPRVAVPKRKTWHTRTRRPMDSVSVAGYREGLTPTELALMERVAGERLERFGYSLDGTGTVSLRTLAQYRQLDAKRRFDLVGAHAKDRMRDRRLRQPVAARLTSAQLALAAAAER